MSVKKVAVWGLVLLLAYFVVVQPDSAANSVSNVVDQVKVAGDSGSRFISEVTNG